MLRVCVCVLEECKYETEPTTEPGNREALGEKSETSRWENFDRAALQ